jgi:DnaA family protein
VPEQFPVQFEFQSTENFDAFYSGINAEVVTHLQRICISHEVQIFLWGEEGSGKSHLLKAACQKANNLKKTAFYFSLEADNLPPPSMLHGLESLDLVCFDNIEQIAGNSDWEKAFFNFFNTHRENNKLLILSASCPPKYLAMQLPDLKTRMSWGLTLKLKPLSNEQRLNALIYKADALGFEISPNVGKFLLLHYASDLPSIWRLLNKMERATLVAQRKLTVPFLKQIMKAQESSDES